MTYPLVKIKDVTKNILKWNPLKEKVDSAFRYFDLSCIDKDEKIVIEDEVALIDGINAPSRARQLINTNDILVSTVRPNLNGVAKVKEANENDTASTGYSVLRANDRINSDYLFYWLQTSSFIDEMVRKATGANYPAISDKIIKDSKIPLPPLKTQQHIAQILDDATDLCDKTKQLLTEYDLLTQSIFLEMFGDPVINPKDWNALNLKKLTTKIGSGATPRGGKEAYKEEGMSLIRSLNIHDNKFKLKNLAFIDDAQAAKLRNVKINKNDVLINITGASVARCAIVPNEILPARVNQHVSILRSKKDILNPTFLLHLIISPNSKVKFLGVGSSNAATRESITKEQLETFEIVVPPIELQNQFAEKIGLIEQQKELAQQELKESEDLFNCLLQKAFK